MARARERFLAQSASRVFPRKDAVAREQQRLRKGAPHDIEFMQHGDDGAPFCAPARDQRQQIVDRRFVDRPERLVEQDHRLVLHDELRKERALHLSAGKRIERALLEAGEVPTRL